MLYIQINRLSFQSSIRIGCICLFLCFFLHFSLQAQDSTTSETSSVIHDEAVVVTATRSERKLSNIAVPVLQISQKQLQQIGALRLNEALQEQTGLVVTAGTGRTAVGGGIFGNGIQMQGMSPDHVLILLDGEPIIGRQGGVLDLSRFAVGNIRKIEVIKGPSSALYGNEAMGGVINIITQPATGTQAQVSARAGAFGTTDFSTSAHWQNKNSGVYFFANRNASNGYDLEPSTIERTNDPWRNYTAQLKWQQQFSQKSKLVVNTRHFNARQESYYAINSPQINIGGIGNTSEWQINPVWYYRFHSRLQTSFRFMSNLYVYEQQLDTIANKNIYYKDRFAQNFFRAENQTEWRLNETHSLTFGGGYTGQWINTSRYAGKRQQDAAHLFVQHEWQPSEKILVVGGLRYDHNEAFRGSLSPKLAVQYNTGNGLRLRASYGRGFKAPDFRQLYLSFLNNAAEGYIIYGASEFSVEQLQQQQNAGLIASIYPEAYQIRTLLPEMSSGINLGAEYRVGNKLTAEVNLFRNDIQNLINYVVVARQVSNANVFSYVNINRAYTQGFETNLTYQLIRGLQVQAGYQYLYSADKKILEDIRDGKVYGRDYAGGPAKLMTRRDYHGLNQRSPHQANFRLFYEAPKNGWQASCRIMYRSAWGVMDNDGNGFANQVSEKAPSYTICHIQAGKSFAGNWLCTAGINNLFNYTDVRNLPQWPGRNWYLTLAYTFKKQHKTNS
jgi:outer membrane receptor for ferrienterochelin and colicins